MDKIRAAVGILAVLSLVGCTSTKTFEDQKKINEYTQTGIYYYWNGGDLQKVEKEFFKGITLKGKYDVVENSFKEASMLDPDRLDLRFGIATTQVLQSKIQEALATYKDIIKIYPESFDANMLLAGYSRALGDNNTYNNTIAAMEKIYPEMTRKFVERFDRTDNYMNTILKVKSESLNLKNHTIVILGYALGENGVMKEPLIGRLEQGLAMSKKNPDAEIIVTGGVPKGGVTEAYLMKKWLVEKGVNPDKVHIEDQAKDTVGNALYSVEIMKKLGTENMTLISSASHMRRGLAVFKEMAVSEGLNLSVMDNLVYLDYPTLQEAHRVSNNEKLVIYRDMMRAAGMWAYPGIQR